MSDLAGDEDDPSTTDRSPESVAQSSAPPPEPHSEDRPREPGKAAKNDTLVSAPAPGDAEAERVDPRVDDHALRLDQLEARVRVLEMRGETPPPSRAFVPWLVFLVALIVGWQIVRLLVSQ